MLKSATVNCFSFYAITLDNELNAKINEAINVAVGGDSKRQLIFITEYLTTRQEMRMALQEGIYSGIITLLVKNWR